MGHPYEDDECFNEYYDFCKEINFSKLHVFPYSLREGTKASLMDNQIDNITKKERAHILIELSKNLELDYMNKFIDKNLEFIPETYKDGYLYGHTGNYLSIKLKGDKKLINQIIPVKIVNIEYPYCIGYVNK